MRILIDECLSPELVKMAEGRGHEAAHVGHRGWGGLKDGQLMPKIIEDDWTLVTNNAIDFRGPATKPGSRGHYSKVELHAGLVCIGSSEGLDLDLQGVVRGGAR